MIKIMVMLSFLLLLTACAEESETASSTSGEAEGSSQAGNYPENTIEWIIPYGSGGGADQFARNMINAADEVDPSFNFVPINMPGAMTATGLNHLMQQPADGYTIFAATQDTMLTMLQGNADYTIDDLEPVARSQHNLDMWFINETEDRFQDFDGFIDYARENPGELKVATTGLYGTDAVAINRIEEHFNIELKNLPYDEPSERYAALMGEDVDVLHEQPGDILSFLETGEYKPIITMSEETYPEFEDVPTTADYDLDLTTGFWRGVFVKSGTP